MEEALKIAICEDTQADEEKLIEIINNSSIKTSIQIFHSGEELLKVYRPQMFDLLLMDIYMGDMTGVETVTKIREFDEDVPVAFITTSTDFALESYRLSALRYIEKSYKPKEIYDILKLAEMERDNAPSLSIYKNRKECKIRLSQIMYIEQKARKVIIYMSNDESVDIYDKIGNILPQLEGGAFVSYHKSYAVNLAFVKSIDYELKCFVLTDNTNIPIRRENMSSAKEAFEQFLFKTTREI